MTGDTRLIFMTFPQAWRNGELLIRVLVLPRGNPLTPLVPGSPAFADAEFRVATRLIPAPGRLPHRDDALPPIDLGIALPVGRRALYETLGAQFNIVTDEDVEEPPPAEPLFYKYLPPSFRAASGRSGPTRFGLVGDEYACALRAASLPATDPLPEPSVDVSWGDVHLFVIRQPRLAAALGLLFEATIPLPDDHELRSGGWIYTELAAGGDFAAAAAADAELSAAYAANLPALETPRHLFSANLFAVATTPGTPPVDDDVFTENDAYRDGFAAYVHGEQPATSSVGGHDAHPLPAVKDFGIRLGWDDERVLVWLNRQVMAEPNAPGHTPCSVAGYRVDVREADTGGDFTSLVAVRGNLQLGGVPLGEFAGELIVETLPVQFPNSTRHWLPPYFAAWAGGSLVAPNAEAAAFDLRPPEARAPSQYEPTGVDAVPLRYGRDYEFRVRLADLSGGGPPPDAHPQPGRTGTVARIPFRRLIRPRPPSLELAPGALVTRDTQTYRILRPRLGFPEAVFTGAAGAHAALVADISASRTEEREPGIPDPDVVTLEILVEVRAPAGDAAPEGHWPLYSTERSFPGNGHALDLEIDFTEHPDLATFPTPPLAGPLPIPTARDVRISLTAVCSPRPDYYGAEEFRRGLAPLVLNVRKEAETEAAHDLFVPAPPGHHLRALFFQPNAIEEAPLRAAGLRHEAPGAIAARLAQETGLESSALTLFARQGRRLVVGCSAALPHVLAPDRSAIQFAATDDLTRRWIVVAQAEMLRDWTWDGLAPEAFRVVRIMNGVEEEVGTIEMARTVGAVAVAQADRSRSYLCFFDAIEPKVPDGTFPAEIDVRYRFAPRFRQAPAVEIPEWPLRLPISTRPLQTPALASAGIALSPYVRAEDYSSSEPRCRRLWIEFEEPPGDPGDRYFCRVLAHAADPVLAMPGQPPAGPRETPLPIDPESVRVILPHQPEDQNGLDAMQPLEPAGPDGRRYLVPLPPGLNEDSPELFGLFTYEFRLGHDASRWSTARGRFGPPLRVTGVQHPAPGLPCYVVRTHAAVETAAPLAAAVAGGRGFSATPNTEMWFLLYAQVREASGNGWRNVLLKRRQGTWTGRPPAAVDGPVRYASARIPADEAAAMLRELALPLESPLSVLAVELIPAPLIPPRERGEPSNRYADPLGADLGQVRILRTSPLVPVPPAC